MRILLVDPPGKNKGLNTGLAYLSAVLKDRHDIYVLDLNNLKMGPCGSPNPEISKNEIQKRLIHTLDEFNPHLFGVSVKTFTAVVAKEIIHLAKHHHPHLLTVVGGPHITLDGETFIRDCNIDFGVVGEGEYTFFQLCNALDEKKDIDNIGGLFFRKKDQLIHNPKEDVIKDLDVLPFPYYDRFSSVKENNGKIREYPILSSRGCPFNCTYCSMPTIMGKKWRSHESERVIKELKHAKELYQSTSFTVVDDNFTLNLNRVEMICDLLVKENVSLPWNSQNGIRADRINESLAKKMYKAGCQFVWIGIESADEYVFNQINKGERLEDIEKGISNLKKAGIRVGGFFITGLPHSTRETDLKGVDFVRENQIEGWWFNFVPYPHTESYKWVQNYGKAVRSSDGVLQFGTGIIEPVFETREYSKEDRIQTYIEIHVRLKYFDRLADYSLRSYKKWLQVYRVVAPFGLKAIVSLMVFVLKDQAKSILSLYKK